VAKDQQVRVASADLKTLTGHDAITLIAITLGMMQLPSH
jgi:hypothetical protein